MSVGVELQFGAFHANDVLRAGAKFLKNSKFQVPDSRRMLEARVWNLEPGTWNFST
jgi:hypothetical protein